LGYVAPFDKRRNQAFKFLAAGCFNAANPEQSFEGCPGLQGRLSNIERTPLNVILNAHPFTDLSSSSSFKCSTGILLKMKVIFDAMVAGIHAPDKRQILFESPPPPSSAQTDPPKMGCYTDRISEDPTSESECTFRAQPKCESVFSVAAKDFLSTFPLLPRPLIGIEQLESASRIVVTRADAETHFIIAIGQTIFARGHVRTEESAA
jgi:hypothetical protein